MSNSAPISGGDILSRANGVIGNDPSMYERPNEGGLRYQGIH